MSCNMCDVLVVGKTYSVDYEGEFTCGFHNQCLSEKSVVGIYEGLLDKSTGYSHAFTCAPFVASCGCTVSRFYAACQDGYILDLAEVMVNAETNSRTTN